MTGCLEVRPAVLCCADERLHIHPCTSHNADGELKEHLPMKDFLPVFMSSLLWVCLYLLPGTECAMNERLSGLQSVQVIERMRDDAALV